MRNKHELIVVLGPTASGKSKYAIKLAKKIGGEIISADSRQIYNGLDIGTAKIKGQLCTDIVDPKKTATIVEWKKCAENAIASIYRRIRIPILVGGSAFYIRAVVDGLVLPEVQPNQKLRKKLEKKSLESLLILLEKKDARRAKTVDRKNKRRVIRALEIVAALGKVPELKTTKKYDAKFIGIKRSLEDLKKRIIARTEIMFKKGLIHEVRKLRRSGIPWKRFNEFGFEYKYPALYLQKKISRKEMIEKINKETIAYTRRQMLWWKKDRRIKWVKS
ncbi:tRNA (adenosine(37)-N6)-dimethylallyltransferase MiaA [Candidatus Giovannonibacteria bacterium RIFCSPLOWO2_02_FULL_43_11b]|uniref:tRNA dimethylallyltransferase n=1 Tax=Candidatus Giovannonibacteria bacterium RIFCSPHIGHO2_12_FULL_43_15 TaxID=1798341 RepID=A0A1F5WQ42_9BACT|nr:MAG: tRNA (adenosine(37)-N6)-dimethylallyltransferase MiaA [Candidatus Giovannonibacteria bacterium RIFCSPHIGHO2_01_FULL_43_100]OGF66365.1 MAG: tRNA (adenosine(37)-N6)-dimethylallyltransferase MiaA [Candidatus Giovannonibacteria bacterium RIFCSPHIGHO2_02_FULL_43_32]OGF77724.1 MAG: tRNA (adenosine(37)-N6)-dimethylallyltransferase MiaA [Candidatus Giovannonibacteria bacterium RIFCSPHIGHO2_12_FULL_43_15]OGF78065.1 MAG: tRNA (adenosine(37)-N6)-dimethylallyltransferase MiaA [Candidatus Giovannonib